MKTYIFHSVNAGLFFWNQKDGLLIDGIHEGKQEGFSNMPVELIAQMRSNTGIFQLTNQILFTHLHPDHYSPFGVDCMTRLHPDAQLYAPGLPDCNGKETAGNHPIHMLEFPSGTVYAKNTLHEGERFRNDLHQSYYIKRDAESFFVAGDAVLQTADAEAFAPFLNTTITAGFFNLYQLYSKEGQDFVRNLPFERVFLYHLPFPEDDIYHYATLAKQVVKNPPAGLPRAEILPHMSWIDQRQPKGIQKNSIHQNRRCANAVF